MWFSVGLTNHVTIRLINVQSTKIPLNQELQPFMNGDIFSTCVEIFGYISSLLVVFSLTRTSVRKLWTINAFGCVGFIIFALITHSYPTALMNFGALIIDIVQLYRLGHIKISFELVPVTKTSNYFQWFVKKHVDGIHAIDPEGRYLTAENLFFYVRNDEVAGLLAYNQENDTANIVLDYVTTKFRDCKIGQYFFSKDNHFFFDAGISTFIATTSEPSHKIYLQQIGFSHSDGDLWEKKIIRE